MTDAAARPERGAIKATDITFRAFIAEGAAACINDVGICGANMFDIEFVFLPYRRQIVGEKYISGFGDFIQQLLTFFCRYIDADTALAAIRMFDQWMTIGINDYAAHVDETTL